LQGVAIYSLALVHGTLLIGATLTALNAVFWAAYSVYYRKLRHREPMPLLATQFLLGSIPMVIGALFFPAIRPSTNFVIDMVYVIVFTGLIQYYLWNGLLRRGRGGKNHHVGIRRPRGLDSDRFCEILRDSKLPFNRVGRS
jgi:drug/metabolite transporter (DMT)-like permease